MKLVMIWWALSSSAWAQPYLRAASTLSADADNTFGMMRATPSGRVMIVAGPGDAAVAPNGVCAGTNLQTGTPKAREAAVADAMGFATATLALPRAPDGRMVVSDGDGHAVDTSLRWRINDGPTPFDDPDMPWGAVAPGDVLELVCWGSDSAAVQGPAVTSVRCSSPDPSR